MEEKTHNYEMMEKSIAKEIMLKREINLKELIEKDKLVAWLKTFPQRNFPVIVREWKKNAGSWFGGWFAMFPTLPTEKKDHLFCFSPELGSFECDDRFYTKYSSPGKSDSWSLITLYMDILLRCGFYKMQFYKKTTPSMVAIKAENSLLCLTTQTSVVTKQLEEKTTETEKLQGKYLSFLENVDKSLAFIAEAEKKVAEVKAELVLLRKEIYDCLDPNDPVLF